MEEVGEALPCSAARSFRLPAKGLALPSTGYEFLPWAASWPFLSTGFVHPQGQGQRTHLQGELALLSHLLWLRTGLGEAQQNNPC